MRVVCRRQGQGRALPIINLRNFSLIRELFEFQFRDNNATITQKKPTHLAFEQFRRDAVMVFACIKYQSSVPQIIVAIFVDGMSSSSPNIVHTQVRHWGILSFLRQKLCPSVAVHFCAETGSIARDNWQMNNTDPHRSVECLWLHGNKAVMRARTLEMRIYIFDVGDFLHFRSSVSLPRAHSLGAVVRAKVSPDEFIVRCSKRL